MNPKKSIHLPQTVGNNAFGLSFGEVIQKYRNLAKMNQGDLAASVGVSRNTIINWENNKSKPDPEAIRKMTETIGLPLYELFGVANAPTPSPEENRMLNQYRQLSVVGQKVVGNMIDNMLCEELAEQSTVMKATYAILPLEETPAAAGEGFMFSDVPAEPFFFKVNSVNQSTDRIIRVSGDSMLPVYHDGDFVYVQDAEHANNNDIVIAAYHEGLVIKRYYNNRLYSLNDNLPFGKKTESDNIRIVGKVVGIVEDDEMPTKDEKSILQNVFSDELTKFYKKYGE